MEKGYETLSLAERTEYIYISTEVYGGLETLGEDALIFQGKDKNHTLVGIQDQELYRICKLRFFIIRHHRR